MDYSITPYTVNGYLGQPILECKPFAHVVNRNHKGHICDYCLKSFTVISATCNCCNDYFYCSKDCFQKDIFHKNECALDIHNKILTFFYSDDFKETIPKFFLSHEDIINYTHLFFRVLSCIRILNDQSKESEIGKIIQPTTFPQVSWQDIESKLEINEMLEDYDELVNDYIVNYDSLTEEERIKRDIELELNIPNDSFFTDLTKKDNYLGEIFESLMGMVIDSTTPNGNFLITEENANSSGRVLTSQKDFFNSQENMKIYDNFMADIKERRTSNKFLIKNKELLMNTLSKKFDFNSDIDEFDIMNKFRNELSQEKQIYSFKFMYRVYKLDVSINEKIEREKVLFDSQFDFWIIFIKKILRSEKVKEQFSFFTWNEIVKAFYMTLRYSIAIPDKLYNDSVARAIFMPMTLMNHACLPNTAAIFDGSTMKLFRLPSKKLQVKSGLGYFNEVYYDQADSIIYDPKLSTTTSTSNSTFIQYLPLSNDEIPLKSCSYDFNYDLFGKIDFNNLLILNKTRLLDCYCIRCNQNELSDHDSNEEYNYLDLEENDQDLVDWGSDFQSVDQEKFDDFCNFFNQFNAKYGNFLDNIYSMKIQLPVTELLQNYREKSGYYHPRISFLHLFLVYSNLILIENLKENLLIFYRYMLIHNYIVQAIDEFALTHGVNNGINSVLNKIHTLVHKQLSSLYKCEKSIICTIEGFKEKKVDSWPSDIFSKTKCFKLCQLQSKVIDIVDKDLILTDGSVYPSDAMQKHDYSFNPFKKHCISSIKNNEENLIVNIDDAQTSSESAQLSTEYGIKEMLALMGTLCDFSDFRNM